MKTSVTTMIISLVVFLIMAFNNDVESHVRAFLLFPSFAVFVGSMIYIIRHHDDD